MGYLCDTILIINPMNRILFYVALIATAIAIFSTTLLCRSRHSVMRLEHNQEALMQSVEHYKTRAQHSVATVAKLELSVAELRRLRREDADKIRLLGIKLRRAESYAKSVAQTECQTSVPLRDTIIVHDTVKVFDTLLAGHTRLSGRVSTDSLYVDIRQRDTIYQVVHRVPRKFLFFRFGTKAIRQDVWSSNPNTEIVYTEYIELSKPKRVAKRRQKG